MAAPSIYTPPQYRQPTGGGLNKPPQSNPFMGPNAAQKPSSGTPWGGTTPPQPPPPAPASTTNPKNTDWQHIFGQWGQFLDPNNVGWKQFGNLLNQMFPWLANQGHFAMSLEPQRQALISNFMGQMSPGNRQSQVDAFRQNALAGAKDTARTQGLMAQSGGAGGTGLQQGIGLEAANQANSAANQFSGQLNSPQGQMQALQALMGGIGEGQNMTALSPLTSLFNSAQAGQGAEQNLQLMRDQMNQGAGSGLMGGLGSLLGGGGLSSLFGMLGMGGMGGGMGGGLNMGGPGGFNINNPASWIM